jgi:hypothetical protein
MPIGDGEKRLVAVLLGAYAVALGYQSWSVGITFDEPARMLGAYLYWLNRPDLYPQDLPPLVHILTGWIPRVLEIPLHLELPVWQHGWKQAVASELMDRLTPEQLQQLFYLMRLVMSTFAVLTAALVWRWSRLLLGPRAALLVLVVTVLGPNLLAHGCLLNSDAPCTFAYFWFAYQAWRFWLQPNFRNSLLVAASILLGILAKMSLLILPPLGVALVAARALRGPRPLARWLVPTLAAVVLIPYIGLLAAYKFDLRTMTQEEVTELRQPGVLPAPFRPLAPLLRVLPLPVDVDFGILSIGSYGRDGAPSYFLGEARSRGSWAYYLVSLALKTPIAAQVLIVGGLVLFLAHLRHRGLDPVACFLLLPPAFYLFLASESNLQLGVRLVLPAVPFLLVLTGFTIREALATRRGCVALTVLLVWLAGTCAAIYPHGLAYFNRWAGGPEEGARYLVDSNLDWGQDLPELADYLRRNGIKKIRLYYFGFDKLHRYGIQDRVEVVAPPWGPDLVKERRLEPAPGLYAISATLLPGHFFPPQYRDYFEYFRRRKPDARAGYSIFIYKVGSRP